MSTVIWTLNVHLGFIVNAGLRVFHEWPSGLSSGMECFENGNGLNPHTVLEPQNAVWCSVPQKINTCSVRKDPGHVFKEPEKSSYSLTPLILPVGTFPKGIIRTLNKS